MTRRLMTKTTTVLFVLMGLFRPTLLPGLMLVVAIGSHAYWLARALVLVARRS